MPRKKLTRDEITAVCMLEIKRGNGEPIVSRKWAKGKTAQEVIKEFRSRIDLDHIAPRKGGGSDHFSNFQPLTKEDHKEKTTKIDIPRIAKGKRIRKSENEFRAKILAKGGREEWTTTKPKSKWPKRKLQSRGFQKRERAR